MKHFNFMLVISIILLSTSCKTELTSEQKIDKLLKKLTLEQKIKLIHGTTFFNTFGIDSLGIPSLNLSDGPCGVRPENNPNDWGSANWKNDSTAYFPSLTGLASSWNIDLARQFGIAYGEEACIRNKHIMLAPGINIHRTPLNGRNWEYMSEDPYLISQMVVPLIQGIQSQGVASCVKHFALNNQETDRGSINVEVDERALREIYLPGFEAAVKVGGSLAVMGSYNQFRGQHASHNRYLLNTILKGEWAFKGMVISDWDATHNTMQAAENGLDLEMGTNKPSFDEYYMANPLLDSVKSEKVDEKLIDDKVRRILYVMYKIDAIGRQAKDTAGVQAKLATKERGLRVLHVAEECMVLLKNEKNILPFHLNKLKKIAIIGDNANRKHSFGGGSTVIKARYEITPLQGLINKTAGKAEITYSKGYELNAKPSFTNQQLINEAVIAAKAADIAIIVGGITHEPYYDCEGMDKLSIALPFGQDKLISAVIAANPNTIVVLNSGGPLELGEWLEKTPALLYTPYLGMEAGNAIANVLFGDVNPSGKLTDTWGKKLTDWGSHALGEYPGKDTVHYNDGIFVGYRYFDSKNIEPLFPFGFGLSYSSFEYSNISAPSQISQSTDSIKVTFDIKNTSGTDGKEIAQLYVSDSECTLPRPVKELKGFKKVSLKAGESKKIEIAVSKKAFEFFNPNQNKWVTEPGKFEILIGASSRDIKLKSALELN